MIAIRIRAASPSSLCRFGIVYHDWAKIHRRDAAEMSSESSFKSDPSPVVRYDWLEHPRKSAQILAMVAVDAITVFAIACVAQLLAAALALVAGPISWVIVGVTVTLEEIIHYGDFFTFLTFVGVSLAHILQWAIGK
jgi:hypothetical protein